MCQRITDKAICACIATGRLYGLNLMWKEVLHLATPCTFSKNTTIWLQGTKSGDFYYLEKGLVCVKSFSEKGRERTSLFFGSGCLFNIAAALIAIPDPNLWECLEHAKAWRFSGRLLTDTAFILRYPHLLVNLMQGMSVNLLSQIGRQTGIGFVSPLRRVARYIKGLCDAHAGSLDFTPGITQQEAATQLAMHRATLALAIKELKVRQVVACFTYNRLLVLDYPQLQSLAEKE